MKLLTFRSVRLAAFLVGLTSLLEVGMSYSLSLLVVDSVDRLLLHLALVVGLYLPNACFSFFNAKTKALATYMVTQDIKQRCDQWVSQLDYQVFHEKDHGEHLSLYVNDVTKVVDLTVTKFFSMVEKATLTLFVFVVLWAVHYSMALIALASFVLMAMVPGIFQKALSSHILRVQEGKEVYLSKMRELLQGFDTFMENTAFSVFFKKSQQAAFAYARIGYEADCFTALMSAVLTFVNAVVSVVALGLLSYQVMKGQVAPGAFLSVTALLPTFGAAVMECLSEKEFYTSGQEVYKQKFAMLEEISSSHPLLLAGLSYFAAAPDLATVTETAQDEDFQSLEVRNLVLTYPTGSIAYPEKVEFSAGKKYAIIGKSGSGKSSLLKVLTGQLTNYSGQVLKNGRPIASPLFESLSYVNQTTFLFNDSIRHNLDLLGQRTDEEIRAMLDCLQLGEFSLDDLVEDNGKNLSGGQRQRLALGRALLRHKSLLILDEATANLDQELAQDLESHILASQSSVILISHHLSPRIRKQLNEVITVG